MKSIFYFLIFFIFYFLFFFFFFNKCINVRGKIFIIEDLLKNKI